MIANEETRNTVKEILTDIIPYLNEKQKRILYGSVASALGHGGVKFVSDITGAARNTIVSGINELNLKTSLNDDLKENNSISTEDDEEHTIGIISENYSTVSPCRIRKEGGGRKKISSKIPMLYDKIEEIINQNNGTYGDPEKPLRWTTWSLRKIAKELLKYGIEVSQNIVSRALDELGYSKQQNQKMYQVGCQHPDRDAQFVFINETTEEFLAQGEPVISVDTKKKENIGDFKNNGSEYRKKKEPRKVLDHDFPIKELGKVAPYGVYVLNNNTGFVNLGISHDTPEFAGASVHYWWNNIGKNTFPNAKRIFINCDSGGSNGCRTWLWKYALQGLADETGLEIHVSHFPTGTSKWNKIEHRLFCYISKNWQGQPLVDIETVINLIGSTTTEKGLSVQCRLDSHTYEKGIKISEDQKEELNIKFVGPNEKWNYIIYPKNV